VKIFFVAQFYKFYKFVDFLNFMAVNWSLSAIPSTSQRSRSW